MSQKTGGRQSRPRACLYTPEQNPAIRWHWLAISCCSGLQSLSTASSAPPHSQRLTGAGGSLAPQGLGPSTTISVHSGWSELAPTFP